MNEKALQRLFELAKEDGYANTFEDFALLLSNNEEAASTMFNLAMNDGYEKSFEEFSTLIGFVKKKKENELTTALPLETGTSQPSALSRNQRLNITPTAEKDTAIERLFGKNEVTDFFGDLYRSGVQGISQGATVDDALKVFRKGETISDEDLQDYISAVNKMESFGPSDEMQDFSRIYEQEGKGVLGFLKGVLKNKSVIPQLFISSIAAMINKGSISAGLGGAGVGATAGSVAPGIGTLAGGIGGAIGGLSGALETGLAYTEFLQEELAKKNLPFDDDGIRQILSDETAMNKITNRALGRGISIAAIDAVTGGVASNLTRKTAKAVGKLAATGVGIGTEMIGGATGEAVGRAVAGQEMDVAEIGFEGVVGTATAPLTVTAGLLKAPKYKLNGGLATRKQVETLLNEGTPEEIAGANITVTNNQELFDRAAEAKQDAIVGEKIKQTLPKNVEVSNEKLKELVTEFKVVRDLKQNETATSEEIKNAENKYKELKDAIQKPSTEEIPLPKQPETSPAVGDGDPEGAAPSREIAPKDTEAEKLAEESETEIEITEDEIESLSQDIQRAEDEGTLKDNIGEKAYRDGEEGMIKIDDQNVNTLVFETNNQIVELGNIDEVGNNILATQNLTLIPPEGVDVTKVDDAADVVDVDGIKYKIIGRRKDKKGKAVVRVKEIETGLDRRFVGPKAERILKDQALKKPSTPPPVSVTLERVQTTQPEINQVIYEQKSLNEIIKLEKKAKKDLKAFEKTVLNEMVAETMNKDLVQVKENIFQVTQEPDGKFKVSQMREDGKLVPRLDEQIRTTAINKFKQEKNLKEKSLIKKAERKINQFKKDQQDVIIKTLDSFIEKTSTKGRAFDVTIGLPLSIANTSLKVIKAAYKAGKSLAEAIADGIKFLKEQGYRPNEIEYKKFVLENLKKPAPQKSKTTKAKKQPTKVKEQPAPKAKVPPKPTEPAPRPEISKEIQEGVDNVKPAFNKITEANTKLGLDNIASQVKVAVTKRDNVMLQKMRSTPGPYYDQSLGVNNSTVIYDNTLAPIAESQAQLEGRFQKVKDVARQAQSLIDFEGQSKTQKKLGISRLRNKALKDGLEIGLYMQVREANANKIGDNFNNEIAPNPVEMLDASIKVSPEAEAKTLQELYNKYVENGLIDKDKIFENFTPAQKKALKIIDKKNKELEPLIKTILQRRDKSFEPIKEYAHRVVLKSSDQDKIDVMDSSDKYSDPSTRAGTSFERSEGVKPIDYNPFTSLLLGTQETYLDYYVSPEADKVQSITEELKNVYKDGNEGQKQAVDAIDRAVKEILRNTYLRTFMGARDINVGSKVLREVERNAYRAMLSSAPRAMAEYISNSVMLLSVDPAIVADAYTKYGGLNLNPSRYNDILLELGSAEIRKLGSTTTIDNKAIDVNDYMNLGETKQGMINNPVFQKMDQIFQYGPKQIYKGFAGLADTLMRSGDKLVAKPLWPSTFANQFEKNVKEYTGEDIDITMKDFDEISKGESKYITDDKYKKAKLEAVRAADRITAQFVTSGNPINAIIKNVRNRRGEGKYGLMDYYRVVNSYMANFQLNEYATARFAIGALFKSGYLNPRQATALLTGVLGRMTSYLVMYKVFSMFMDNLLGAPEEEQEDIKDLTIRQLIGSGATLAFRGGIGNIWSLPINLGIENINKNYLDELRDGAPYDAYDNSIVYSLLSLDDFGEKSIPEMAAPILAGPFGPIAKSLFRSADLTARMNNAKTDAAREKAAEELFNRMVAFEFIGLLGYIPLYKDARRLALKKRFPEEKNKLTKSELKKLNPKLYKMLYD